MSKVAPTKRAAPTASRGKPSATTKSKKTEAQYEPKTAPATQRLFPVGIPLGSVLTKADALPSEFPSKLQDLETQGRHGAGFRLDSGTLRLMWMTAKRFQQDSKKGVELFFYLQGAAVGKMEERLKKSGAKSSAGFSFQASDLIEGKTPRLKRKGKAWSPSTNPLTLEKSGAFRVQFCPSSPAALSGAMRITLYGTDSQANKALEEIKKRLGLHHIFAPPTPAALETFKAFRVLWQTAPEEMGALRFTPFKDISLDDIEKALEDAEVADLAKKLSALDKSAFSDPAVKERINLATELAQRSFRDFARWIEDNGEELGVLPEHSTSYMSNWKLKDALDELGMSDSQIGAVTKRALPKAEARKKILRWGLLTSVSRRSASDLAERDVADIKPKELNAALKRAGINPASARMKNLGFQEVYPGYFTVVDPGQPARLKKAGARYLYSTFNTPERVWQALTEGQKSSLTRYGEGLLIEGMSSSADFDSGGSFGVFTRLVTQSAIDKAKSDRASWLKAEAKRAKKKRDEDDDYDDYDDYHYSHSSHRFNDWDGDRPYKLIINRNVLARTDWWGHESDEYGKSHGLTSSNHGEKIVSALQKSYDSDNELMFPVGNDPSFIDFVVCSSQSQKEKLIGYLKSKGFKSHNGKSLNDLVRVEPYYFPHPDD